MDRIFSGLLYEPTQRSTEGDLVPRNAREPITDITETDKHIIATFELPGVDKKDIQINTTDNGVEVKVEKKDEQKKETEQGKSYVTRRSSFYQFVQLPDYADHDNIDASYNNGVLEVKVGKRKLEHTKKRQITVQ